MRRTSFQADQLPQTPYIVHYAPGTVEDDNMQECVGPPQHRHAPARTGSGRSHGSRRSTGIRGPAPNGSYSVIVRAFDVAGNGGSRTVAVVVKN